MVRATKVDKSASKASAPSAATEVVAPVAASAAPAAAATKPKAEKKPKAAAPAAAPVAAAPVAPAVPVVAAPAAAAAASTEAKAEEPRVSSDSILTEMENKVQQVGAVYLTLKADIRNLRKNLVREKKDAEKASKLSKAAKKAAKAKNPNRKQSGFTMPTRISDELAKFLGKAPGTEMSRTDVAKEIINYIQTNQLKDKTNGRIIHPDAALSGLFKISDKDQLHFFNLQTFMKPHFIKNTAAAVATA
jgi:chromatin remodeling complex protein RSC6